MAKRFYFFVTAAPDTKRERLRMVPATTEQEARRGLFRSMNGKDFSYKGMGYVPEEEMYAAVIPESGIQDPIQAISAIQYVSQEYAHLFSPQERTALKNARKKMVKDFFG